MTFFAEFLERLRNTEDGNGSMLDSSTIVYGAGMADSNSHYSRDLPILLAGNVAHGGYHLQYPENTPLTNLHLSLLDKLGTPIDSLGDSTGRYRFSAIIGVVSPNPVTRLQWVAAGAATDR